MTTQKNWATIEVPENASHVASWTRYLRPNVQKAVVIIDGRVTLRLDGPPPVQPVVSKTSGCCVPLCRRAVSHDVPVLPPHQSMNYYAMVHLKSSGATRLDVNRLRGIWAGEGFGDIAEFRKDTVLFTVPTRRIPNNLSIIT